MKDKEKLFKRVGVESLKVRRQKIKARRAEILERAEKNRMPVYPRPTNIQLAVLVTMRDGYVIGYKKAKQERFWLKGRHYPKIKRSTVSTLENHGWIEYSTLPSTQDCADIGEYRITPIGKEVAKYWMGML